MFFETQKTTIVKQSLLTWLPLKAFEFTGEVAIVTGAGSRMPGKLSSISYLNMQEDTDKY